MASASTVESCPHCKTPFNASGCRKITETCGHEGHISCRFCFMRMSAMERCHLCSEMHPTMPNKEEEDLFIPWNLKINLNSVGPVLEKLKKMDDLYEKKYKVLGQCPQCKEEINPTTRRGVIEACGRHVVCLYCALLTKGGCKLCKELGDGPKVVEEVDMSGMMADLEGTAADAEGEIVEEQVKSSKDVEVVHVVYGSEETGNRTDDDDDDDKNESEKFDVDMDNLVQKQAGVSLDSASNDGSADAKFSIDVAMTFPSTLILDSEASKDIDNDGANYDKDLLNIIPESESSIEDEEIWEFLEQANIFLKSGGPLSPINDYNDAPNSASTSHLVIPDDTPTPHNVVECIKTDQI